MRHDYSSYCHGRCRCPVCTTAWRDYKRAIAARRAGPLLPAAPLVAVARAHAAAVGGWKPLEGVVGGAVVRAVRRAETSGVVAFWAADRAACAFGLHPVLLWPREFLFDAEPVAVAS